MFIGLVNFTNAPAMDRYFEQKANEVSGHDVTLFCTICELLARVHYLSIGKFVRVFQ
jgi:hypothetical protein